MTRNVSRKELLDRIAATLGAERFNRLVQSVEDTQKKRRLRYWQEEMFNRLESQICAQISSCEDFVELFGDAQVLCTGSPDPAAYRKLWEEASPEKENLIYGIAREVSKHADLDVCAHKLQEFAKFFQVHDMIHLYERIRDISKRPEFEWRARFIHYFPESSGVLPIQQTEQT